MTHEMDITPEMLAVAVLSPKEKHGDDGAAQDPDQLKLTRVLLSSDGTMVATDDTIVALVRRHAPRGDEPKKGTEPFSALLPSEQVRRVDAAAAKLQADELTIRRSGSKATVEARTEQGEASLQLDAFDAADFPNPERFFGSQGQIKAQVALDSRYLADIAKLRARVGGHGPILFFVHGENSNVVAAWRADLHEARVILASTQVDRAEWEALAPKKAVKP